VEIWPNTNATTAGTLDVRNTSGSATISLAGATGGISCNNLTVNGVAVTSDRNAKEGFTPVSAKDVLDKVAALAITEWKYKTDSGEVRHVGPMAQDFHEAFELNGGDDKHISLVDEGGVALAAIQGLNQKLEGKGATMAEQAREIEDLKRENGLLAQRLDELTRTVKQLARQR